MSSNFRSSRFETDFIRSDSRTAMISVCIAGLGGVIKNQARPLMPTMLRHSDVLLVQAAGDQYKPDEFDANIAEVLDAKLKTHRYGRVVMNGISIGGDVAIRTLKRLGNNGSIGDSSVDVCATMFDTPTSRQDLAEPFRTLSLASAYPGGDLTNLLGRLLPHQSAGTVPAEKGVDRILLQQSFDDAHSIPLSFLLDQGRSVAYADELQPDSLNELAQLTVWESTEGGNMVRPVQSRLALFAAAGPNVQRNYVRASMPHVAFEQFPRETERLAEQVYTLYAAQ